MTNPETAGVQPVAWMPIDSAPKDGTVVDLWCNHPLGNARRICGYWWTDRTGWRTGLRTHDAKRLGLTPTHWRPEPRPPGSEPHPPAAREDGEALVNALAKGGVLIDEISAARQTAGISGQGAGTFAALIVAYRASPEWNGLAATTQNSWRTWLDRIDKKFGKARLNIFNSRKIRRDILIWRDQWGSQPRSADLAIQVLSRVLSFGVDRGLLEKNQTSGIKQLYDTNRSEIIWTPEDFAAFHQHSSIEVSEAVDLAACTGLRRGVLVEVPWSAVGEHAIIWQTNKSRGRARIVVPLLPETREVLARIKARHAAEMEAVRPSRRKPLPETILSNSWWRPWTAMGFGSRFRDGRDAAKLTVHLHDLRGSLRPAV